MLYPNFYFENTKEALAYYEKALGAKVIKQVPANADLAKRFDFEESKANDFTMHSEFEVLGMKMMASDNFRNDKLSYNGIAVMLDVDINKSLSMDDVNKFWDNLSDVTVMQPLSEQSWGGYMGEFMDKYGIRWLITVN